MIVLQPVQQKKKIGKFPDGTSMLMGEENSPRIHKQYINQIISNCNKCYTRNKQNDTAEGNKGFQFDGVVTKCHLSDGDTEVKTQKMRSQLCRRQVKGLEAGTNLECLRHSSKNTWVHGE